MEQQMNTPSGMSTPTVTTPSGWSWGAAGLTWIWGIRFGVWLALLTFIPALGGIWWIVLGIKGKEWAWQARKWTSMDEFTAAMKPWDMWGKILFIVSIALPIVMFLWILSMVSVSTVTNTTN